MEALTMLFSVVKSRLQAGHAAAARYRSALHGLRLIIAEEGFGGIYKGVASKLLQSVLTAAILFASQRRFYELTKKVASLFLYQSYACFFTSDQGDYAGNNDMICFGNTSVV
jgi:Mitochondrial carrier protein